MSLCRDVIRHSRTHRHFLGQNQKGPTWWSAKRAGERESAGRSKRRGATIASSDQLRFSIAERPSVGYRIRLIMSQPASASGRYDLKIPPITRRIKHEGNQLSWE